MREITITSAVERFSKQKIMKALIHNHRAENSHRNIVNDNTCYFMEDNGITEIPKWLNKSNTRKRLRDKSYRLYNKHFKRQMKLLSERAERLGITRPKEKDLRPIVEGVVNFGGAYDIKTATKEERLAKTAEFNKDMTELDLLAVTKLIKENLQRWANEFNLEILDLTIHTDESGLIHAHYLTTHYDSKTGMAQGIRNNKNNIGWRLQEIIAEGFEQFNNDKYKFVQTKGKRGLKPMTKEELIAFRNESEALDGIKQEVEQAKEELQIVKNEMTFTEMEFKRISMDLEKIIGILSELDIKSDYATKKKIDKIISASEYAIGKNNMPQAEQQIANCKRLAKALDKKNKTGGSLIEEINNITKI